MAICPFAIWDPLPANSRQARMNPRVFIYHTVVDSPGPSNPKGWFIQSGLESHFYVHSDGTLRQFMDTNVVAEANYKANGFAISVETEDDGHPNDNPWNPAMLDTLIRLADWACTVHGIPRSICDYPYGSGIGWHSMWGYNTKANPNVNPWTNALVKVCPGPARIPQVRDIIIPSLAGRRVADFEQPKKVEEPEMALSTEQWGVGVEQWGVVAVPPVGGSLSVGPNGQAWLHLRCPNRPVTIHGVWIVGATGVLPQNQPLPTLKHLGQFELKNDSYWTLQLPAGAVQASVLYTSEVPVSATLEAKA